jgi:hypothetical protein
VIGNSGRLVDYDKILLKEPLRTISGKKRGVVGKATSSYVRECWFDPWSGLFSISYWSHIDVT